MPLLTGREDWKELIMLIPKFWEQANYGGEDRDGKHVAFSVWGWSCESAADAKELAAERAKRAFDWWVNGSQRREAYDYLDQPLREEIVETIGSDDDQTAVITRNRYGALVLNMHRFVSWMLIFRGAVIGVFRCAEDDVFETTA